MTMIPKSKIFIASNDTNHLHPVRETPYSDESFLQSMLAKNPDLVPGDQINSEDPRRWMLVYKEAGIPSEEDGGSYWRIDHIFVDHEGTPTFIECKRSSDPHLRRNVVAQLLEYAANATEYWPKGELRRLAELTAKQNNSDPVIELQNLLQINDLSIEDNQDDTWVNDFWATVDSNIAACRIRLLFVADCIPKELRRLVEFLNTQMNSIEVLAVEIKQYTDRDKKFRTFVSRIIGQTESIQQKKAIPKRKHFSIEDQIETFPQSEIFKRLTKVIQNKNHTLGTGIRDFSIKRPINNKLIAYAFGRPDGPSLQFSTEYMKDHPDLKLQIEELLDKRGHFRKGKCTITLPIDDNFPEICDHLCAVIDLVDSYAARFDSE